MATASNKRIEVLPAAVIMLSLPELADPAPPFLLLDPNAIGYPQVQCFRWQNGEPRKWFTEPSMDDEQLAFLRQFNVGERPAVFPQEMITIPARVLY